MACGWYHHNNLLHTLTSLVGGVIDLHTLMGVWRCAALSHKSHCYSNTCTLTYGHALWCGVPAISTQQSSFTQLIMGMNGVAVIVEAVVDLLL